MTTVSALKKVALIIGAGDGTGASVARAFSKEGFTICVARRDKVKLEPLIQEISQSGGQAFGFGVDARKEGEVRHMIEEIESKIGQIEVAVFNPGSMLKSPVTETSAEAFKDIWEILSFAGFLFGKEVALRMQLRGHGSIIFTGATGSLRGAANFGAFASAKAGLRALAQSMAKELGPQGIHVSHVIIDGGINGTRLLERYPQLGELVKVGGLVEPDEIASNYVHLHNQHKSTWTFELDLRPYMEKW